jgi:hypothetical protein
MFDGSSSRQAEFYNRELGPWIFLYLYQFSSEARIELEYHLKVHKQDNFFCYLNPNLIWHWLIFEKNFNSFPSIFARILMFEHFRGD